MALLYRAILYLTCLFRSTRKIYVLLLSMCLVCAFVKLVLEPSTENSKFNRRFGFLQGMLRKTFDFHNINTERKDIFTSVIKGKNLVEGLKRKTDQNLRVLNVSRVQRGEQIDGNSSVNIQLQTNEKNRERSRSRFFMRKDYRNIEIKRIIKSGGNFQRNDNIFGRNLTPTMAQTLHSNKRAFEKKYNDDQNKQKMGNGICPNNMISRKVDSIFLDKTEDKITCKPHKPSQQACLYAKRLYSIRKELGACNDSNSYHFCSVEIKKNTDIKISCMEDEQCKSYTIFTLDIQSGNIVANAYYNTSKDLQHGLLGFVNKAIENKFSFMFIHCHGREVKQLVLLPSIDRNHVLQKNINAININIVLLDSIARSHFYRSLPDVINKFNKINSDSSSSVEVIDFQLFQSIHGHSAENFHALFSGQLFPVGMTDFDKERHNIGIDVLFSKFKQAGYETLYQDDLCWKYWWGMRLELGSPNNWKNFLQCLNKSHIDNTGMAMSSCMILDENKLTEPFNGPKNSQICFNGRFQHSYIFEFLHQYHAETYKYNMKPRISFTTINTGHDYQGLRAQTLNTDLVRFVEDIVTLDNTLTILLADHGNTYTTYTNAIMEGRCEMFHPSFFMLVPKGVQEFLGKTSMNAIRINSNRLFTMLDVHTALRGIAYRVSHGMLLGNNGILNVIPANRSCSDLQLRLPNFCVCEGWDTEAKNDSKQIPVLEFAVGTLNNMITDQRQSLINGRCHRLTPISFLNVRQRISGADLVTTMDFKVEAGIGASQIEDTFHVEVQSTIIASQESREMKLLNFDRISQYGIYRKCKDDKVDIRLCVCSVETSEKPTSKIHDNFNSTTFIDNQSFFNTLPSITKIQVLENEQCIFTLTKTYYETDKKGKTNIESIMAASFEIANLCPKQSFQVSISLDYFNMKFSRKLPAKIIVKGEQMKFVLVIMKSFPGSKSRFKLEINARKV